MGITLPKYKQQVGISGAGTGTLADPSKAGAGWETSAKLVGAGLELGQDYLNKKAVLKDKADDAGYKVRKLNFRQSLEDMETEALLGGATHEEIQSKIYQPAIDKFQSDSREMGYSKGMSSAVDRDFSMEVAKIGVELAGKKNKREIDEHVYDITTEAENLMSNPETYDEGVDNLMGLSEIIGEDKARSAVSGAGYKINNTEIAYLSEAFKTGQIDPKQYVSDMKDLRDRITENSDLNIGHKKTLEANMTYSIASASASQAKSAEKMEVSLSKDVISGDVSPEWKETAIAVYGEEATENIERILFNSLKKVAATNEDVRKGLDMITAMKDSPMSYVDVVNFASSSSGEYGEELRELAAIVAAESINDGAAIAYSKYIPPQTFGPFAAGDIKKFTAPYTGWVANIHDDIIKASETTEDMKLIQGYQRKLINFYYKNPNPTTEEQKEFKSDMLGAHWDKNAREAMAPQVQGKKIVGEKIVDGKRVAVQYEDGTIEEL